MQVDFDKLQPAERKFILVASDDVYQEMKIMNRIKLFLYSTSPFIIPTVFPFLAFMPYPISAIKSILKEGHIPIPHLSPVEASKRYKFDFGALDDGTIYLQHPVFDNRYLIPSKAKEILAQEKLSAFLDLTAALGAKTVELCSAEITEKKSKLSVQETATQFGIDMGGDKAGSRERNVYRSFDDPCRIPFVPPLAEPWLEEEPTFRSLVYARLSSQITSDKIALTLGNSFDLNASIAGSLQKLGIKIGGSYHETNTAKFHFQIDYWRKPAAD